MAVVVFRNGDQLLAEAGADHCGHAALHLHAGGVEVAGVRREHHQGQMDEAVVGDEVSTESWAASMQKCRVGARPGVWSVWVTRRLQMLPG